MLGTSDRSRKARHLLKIYVLRNEDFAVPADIVSMLASLSKHYHSKALFQSHDTKSREGVGPFLPRTCWYLGTQQLGALHATLVPV